LQRSGLLPDLWVSDNSLELPWWVPIRTWTYTATFASPAAVSTAGSVELRFEGCDLSAYPVTLSLAFPWRFVWSSGVF
jgi:hypothetical protein